MADTGYVFEGANNRLAELPGSIEKAGLLLWSHIQNADWSAVSAHWPMAEKQVFWLNLSRANGFAESWQAMADSIDAARQGELQIG